MNSDEKRLFFGFSIDAPWPTDYPDGRIIHEKDHHMTFAFLGNVSYEIFKKELPSFPRPDFHIGPVGKSTHLLFLPKEHSRVVAHHIEWFTGATLIANYHAQVLDWLKKHQLPVDHRPLLSHVTLARAPFHKREWEDAFETLPMRITGIHLYESMGNLSYPSLWHLSLHPAFEEFEHTADIAFTIRAEKESDLFIHAAVALSFRYPPFLNFIPSQFPKPTLEDIIRSLNRMISLCDLEIGCPFKAVSYHGLCKKENNLITWEMIVDV